MKKLMLLVVAVVMTSAFWGQAPAQQTQPARPAQVGRFQLALYQGEMPRMNTYLVDTATGKIWVQVAAPDKTTFWEPMDKVDNEVEEAVFVRKHQKIDAEK